MAETIRGINVVIGAETTGLSKALSDVNQKAKNIQSELKQVEKLLKLDPSNTELLAQKQKLLSDAINNTREKLDRLRAVQEQVNEQFQRGEISEGQYRAFQREVIKTEQELQKLEKQLSEVTGEVKEQGEQVSRLGKEYQEAFEEAKQSLGNAYEQTKKVGAAITAAGAAITAGLGVAVGKAADFEQAMANVYSVMAPDEVAQFRDELENLAITMGAETKYSATEAARGIEELIKAGVSVQDVLEGGLAGALSLATAGELELADAAEIASTALNAFRADAISVQEAADILAGAANASATSVSELKYGLSQVSAVASGVGLSFKDTVTALAVFAQNGLKGSDAGTSLKTMLMRLQPSTKQAAETMAELGIITEDGTNKFIDANGQFKSLAEIAGVLRESLSGLSDAQRLAALETMFGSDAIRAANILYKEGAEGVEAMAEAMGKISAADVAAQKMDTFKGAVEELSGAMETAQISIGNALLPALRVLVSGIQRVVDAFNSLPPGVQSAIAMFSALAAGLTLVTGPMLLLIGFLPQIAAGFSMIVPVMSTVGAVIGGIATPVGIAIAAIGALAGAAFLIVKNWETIRETTAQVWEQIVAIIGPAIEEVVAFVTEQFEGLAKWWRQIWPDLQQAFINIWNGIMAFLKPVINAIVELFKWAWPLIRAIVVETWENIKGVISSALNIITGLINTFAALFTGNWSMLWENIKQIISNALNLIWNLFQLWGTGKILKFVGYLGGQLSKIFRAVWDEAYGIFKSALDKLFNVVKSVFDNILSFITGLGRKFYDAGKGLIEQIKKGIESAVGAVVESVRKLAQKIRDFLPFSPAKTGPLSDLDKLDFGGPIADSIQRAIPQVQGLLNELLALPSTGINVNVTGVSTATAAEGPTQRTIIQNVTIQAPTPLSPSETARQLQRVSRQLAMEWGLA